MFRGRDPLRELEQLFNQFENVQTELPSMLGSTSVDLVSDDDEVTLTVDLPGYDEEDIDVSAHEEFVEITASRGEESEVTDEERYILNERHSSVSRRIPLPESVDVDSGTASYNNGVLTIQFDVIEPSNDSTTIEIE